MPGHWAGRLASSVSWTVASIQQEYTAPLPHRITPALSDDQDFKNESNKCYPDPDYLPAKYSKFVLALSAHGRIFEKRDNAHRTQ